MKISLLALLLALPAAAAETPDTIQKLKDCAAGLCWDTKGQQVTTVPQGAMIMREPLKLRPSSVRRPAEPPRYTVFSHEEVQTMRRRQEIVGTGIAAMCGATVGAMFGGVPGAVIGGLIGAGVAFAVFHLLGKTR